MTVQERARRRRELLDERAQLQALRARMAPRRARRAEALLVQRLTRLSF